MSAVFKCPMVQTQNGILWRNANGDWIYFNSVRVAHAAGSAEATALDTQMFTLFKEVNEARKKEAHAS